jgi:hypothetical protein
LPVLISGLVLFGGVLSTTPKFPICTDVPLPLRISLRINYQVITIAKVASLTIPSQDD